VEFTAKIFVNKTNNQKSIVLPRRIFPLKIDKLPPLVKVKLSIPKDYLAKVEEVK